MLFFRNINAALEQLQSVGYAPTQSIASAVSTAAHLYLPILFQDPSGRGGRELAQAIARVADRPLVSLRCYRGIRTDEAIGHFDRVFRDSCAETEPQSQTFEIGREREYWFSRRFFSPGPLMEAIGYEHRCVLLIEEINNIDYMFEAMLVKYLALWRLSIPNLGMVTARSIPITILATNGKDIIGNALRRQCTFIYDDRPVPQYEKKADRSIGTILRNFIHDKAKYVFRRTRPSRTSSGDGPHREV